MIQKNLQTDIIGADVPMLHRGRGNTVLRMLSLRADLMLQLQYKTTQESLSQ